MAVSTEKLCDVLSAIADTLIEHKDELTELDGPIGDSDHGVNMARGFEAVKEMLPELANEDVATILNRCGMKLVSQVGGSSGPLYGTAFMKAGSALKGSEQVTIEKFSVALDAAVAGVMSRGRSTTGEKTMLDAMVPASKALAAAVANGGDAQAALDAAATAAVEGAEATVPMVATKGRASYLGERSVGHKDPGAASFAYVMQAIAANACQ